MLNLFGKALIFWGTLGSKQMCVGFFHEVKIPKELQNKDF